MMQPYQWRENTRSAFCFTIDVDAESPQLWRGRKQGIRGLNQLEQRRYGLREGIWHLLEALERYGVKATCFVPAYEATTRPWLLETLVTRGHEVALHGNCHEAVADLSGSRFREILEESLEVFQNQVGVKPTGFRSPSWEMTPEALEILRNAGLTYDSSLSGYDHPYEFSGPDPRQAALVEIPIQWPLDDAVFFRHVGGGVDGWPPMPTGETVRGWLGVCEGIHAFGGSCISTVHPWLTGRSGRMALAEALLEHACRTSGIWLTTAGQLAAYHLGSANKGRFTAEAVIPECPAD